MKLLTVTMIGGGNHTIATCAFIRLLRESVASSTGSKMFRGEVSQSSLQIFFSLFFSLLK
jgi:hypothetical protein